MFDRLAKNELVVMLIKTGLKNVLLLTLFNFVNNIFQNFITIQAQ